MDEVWTTRSGEKILVGDMTPEHLRNALRMILRERRHAAAYLINTEEWEEPERYPTGCDQYGSVPLE